MSDLVIASVPGDGIGGEVLAEAQKVMAQAASASGFSIEFRAFPHGADHFLETGETMTVESRASMASTDAILMGAFGDPRVPDMRHARDILLGTRFELDLFINLRPIRCYHASLNPLRKVGPEAIDFVVFRENTEGAYVGIGGHFKKGTPDEIAIQEDVNTRKGVERIIRAAFEYARRHGRRKVTMSDKANALRFGHDLWQRVFAEVATEYTDIESDHLFIDVLAMEMVRDPARFDVIVTCNLFGDIITDLGAALQGGLGLAVSGNLRAEGSSMFEPVHGSAPDIVGQGKANPLAAILTGAMLFEHVGRQEAADKIDRAVRACLEAGEVTPDLGGSLGTGAAGDAVARRVE